MPNFHSGLYDPKYLYDLQDHSDTYHLLSSLLNFEENTKRTSDVVSENAIDKDAMEWLDLVDFKEEPKYDDDRSNPEQDKERKRKHNQIERARRLFIDAKIRELEFLLPKGNEAYHELAKDIKHNKGGILRAAVAYLRILKADQIKKQKFEEKCKIQKLQKKKLKLKLQEYEREMKSYGIPVKEFSVDDISDVEDLTETKNNYNTEELTTGKDQVKTFEQLDDLMDDDSHPLPRNDPMFSSLDCDVSPVSPTLSRCSSTESIESNESMNYHQNNLQQKEKRKIKRHQSVTKPRLELNNTPRIPVVSRPYHFKPRFNLSLPIAPHKVTKQFLPSDTSSMVFPLPQGLSQLADSSDIFEAEETEIAEKVKVTNNETGFLFRSSSSSSEDEQGFSSIILDQQDENTELELSPTTHSIPLSVIRKTVSKVHGDTTFKESVDENVCDKPCKRKIILQERV